MPDFGQLARLLQIVVTAQTVTLDVSALVSLEAIRFEEECQGAIDQFIKVGMFQEARQFASESGINADRVTQQEVSVWGTLNLLANFIYHFVTM